MGDTLRHTGHFRVTGDMDVDELRVRSTLAVQGAATCESLAVGLTPDVDASLRALDVLTQRLDAEIVSLRAAVEALTPPAGGGGGGGA